MSQTRDVPAKTTSVKKNIVYVIKLVGNAQIYVNVMIATIAT